MVPPPSGSRRARAGAWGLLVLVLATSLPWTVHAWYDPTNDGSLYVATARALLAGEGYSYLGVPFLIRPPGFSCLIAPLLALRGTDFYALNLLVSLCGALGILLFHRLLRERCGLVLATVVPLVLWFNPGYQELCNQVMSDVPGWSALLVCLLLARGVGTSAARAGVLGVVLGFAALLRSGNALLVPALLCAWLAAELCGPERLGWRVAARRGLALVGGTLLVLAPWSLRNAQVAPPPPADQTLLYSYSSGMWHRDLGDPHSPRVPLGEVLARSSIQGPKLLHTLGTNLGEGAARPITPFVGALWVAVLLVVALRRRRGEEFFALGTLLVVLFYFGYAGRLLLPVYALSLAAAAELLREVGTRFLGARGGTLAAAAAALALLAHDWHPRRGWREIEELHRAYLETARQVHERLPPEARLGAYRGWHHAVYLERPVYSFEQACERAGTPAAYLQIVEKYALDTVLLTPLGLPAPVQRAERAFASLVASRHGARDLGLVRVR